MLNLRKRPPSHPGGILKRLYMEPLSITVTELAAVLGVSRKTTSKVINERGSVTPDMALRLSRAFKTSPNLWLNLQKNYDIWHAANDSSAWKNVKPLQGVDKIAVPA